MKLRTISLLFALLFAASAQAQTANTVKQGKAFQLAADVDGVNTTFYRLYRGGTVVDSKPVTGAVAGVVTFDVAGTLAPGAYTYELAAFGPGGESKSAPLVVTVEALPPTQPKNFRFVVSVTTAADGTETLSFHLVPDGGQ